MRVRFRRYPRYALGIDFGTTTSRACIVDNSEETFADIGASIRSLTSPRIDPNGKYVWTTGEQILRTNPSIPHYARFKLDIGEQEELILTHSGVPEQVVSLRPEILAAHILKLLYTQLRSGHGDLPDVRNVSIGVPAEWNMLQRQATIMAARIAGFPNVHLIEEPVAAFLALDKYLSPANQRKRLTTAKNILVFDYGGGTLDVTVIHRPEDGKAPYVKARSTLKKEIAGEAIDRLLIEKIVPPEHYQQIRGNPTDLRILEGVTKWMKEELNPRQLGTRPGLVAVYSESVYLRESRINYAKGDLRLTLDALKEVVAPNITKAQEEVAKAVNGAGLNNNDDIEVVVLVGGSSYLRPVHEMLIKKFPKLSFDNGIILDRPEEIVAIGTGLYQSYRDRRVERFRLRLPMQTYLSYERRESGEMNVEQWPIGDTSTFLPLSSPRPPHTIAIPKDKQEIHWEVHQKHAYSIREPDVVEEVSFTDLNGRGDQLRLNYTIDSNGCFQDWKPELVLQQKKKPVTGSSRKYIWLDEKPAELANKYSIHNLDG